MCLHSNSIATSTKGSFPDDMSLHDIHLISWHAKEEAVHQHREHAAVTNCSAGQ